MGSSGQHSLRKSPACLAARASFCPLIINSLIYLVRPSLLSAFNSAEGVTCSFYPNYALENCHISKLQCQKLPATRSWEGEWSALTDVFQMPAPGSQTVHQRLGYGGLLKSIFFSLFLR